MIFDISWYWISNSIFHWTQLRALFAILHGGMKAPHGYFFLFILHFFCYLTQKLRKGKVGGVLESRHEFVCDHIKCRKHGHRLVKSRFYYFVKDFAWLRARALNVCSSHILRNQYNHPRAPFLQFTSFHGIRGKLTLFLNREGFDLKFLLHCYTFTIIDMYSISVITKRRVRNVSRHSQW